MKYRRAPIGNPSCQSPLLLWAEAQNHRGGKKHKLLWFGCSVKVERRNGLDQKQKSNRQLETQFERILQSSTRRIRSSQSVSSFFLIARPCLFFFFFSLCANFFDQMQWSGFSSDLLYARNPSSCNLGAIVDKARRVLKVLAQPDRKQRGEIKGEWR
jgi:hypothetical protein